VWRISPGLIIRVTAGVAFFPVRILGVLRIAVIRSAA